MSYRSQRLIASALALAIAAVGAIAIFARSLDASPRTPATEPFSAFSKTEKDRQPQVAVSRRIEALTRADLTGISVLGAQLGRFNSKLYAYPANGDRNVCVGIKGASGADPAALFCYSPTPAKHFNVMALQALTASGIGVQLYGLADDTVTRIRVNVSGQWRDVPLANNGIYLDLPGVQNRDVSIVEATLKDGTIQTHDVQNP